jgi:hypothetical protein
MLDSNANRPALSAPKLTPGFNEETIAWLALAILILGAAVWTSYGPLVEHTDFTLTYVGARLIRSGQGTHLYDLQEQIALRASIFKHPNPLFYEHPPFEALIFSPLAALPFRAAFLVWALINCLVWLFLPYHLRPYTPAPRDGLAYLALWAVFAPLGVALFQGQPSIILLLVYSATFIAWKDRQTGRAGFYLGLGLFRFQFVLPFLLIFVLQKRWRFLGGFLVSATLAFVLSLIAVGWHGIMDYARLLLNISHNPGNVSYGAAADMPTLQGFVYAILGQRVSSAAVAVTVALLSLVLVAMTAWQWNRLRQNGATEVMFAVAIAVSLISGFHMFTHDFSPLLLALFLVAAHFPAPGRSALRITLATLMAFFWMPPVYFALVTWHGMYLMFVPLLVFVVAAIILARNSGSPASLSGSPHAETMAL